MFVRLCVADAGSNWRMIIVARCTAQYALVKNLCSTGMDCLQAESQAIASAQHAPIKREQKHFFCLWNVLKAVVNWIKRSANITGIHYLGSIIDRMLIAAMHVQRDSCHHLCLYIYFHGEPNTAFKQFHFSKVVSQVCCWSWEKLQRKELGMICNLPGQNQQWNVTMEC